MTIKKADLSASFSRFQMNQIEKIKKEIDFHLKHDGVHILLAEFPEDNVRQEICNHYQAAGWVIEFTTNDHAETWVLVKW